MQGSFLPLTTLHRVMPLVSTSTAGRSADALGNQSLSGLVHCALMRDEFARSSITTSGHIGHVTDLLLVVERTPGPLGP